MLVVETIARIRRDHLVRGVPIKKIARDLRVSKNTVRKVVRGDETSFSYERKTLHEAARPPIDYRDNLRRATQGGQYCTPIGGQYSTPIDSSGRRPNPAVTLDQRQIGAKILVENHHASDDSAWQNMLPAHCGASIRSGR